MRISDWSSDVCSSDLLRIGEGVGHRIDRRPGDRVRDQHLVQFVKRMLGRPGGDERIQGRMVLGSPIACQIGRASCRARVCQYVSISVGAVSLKKKLTRHEIQQIMKYTPSYRII